MLIANKHILPIAFVFYLLFSAGDVLACSCPRSPQVKIEDEIKHSLQKSTTVFVGKVVGFEYRKDIPREFGDRKDETGKQIDYETLVVKFQVERVWKGKIISENFLATSQIRYYDGTGSSSCDYSFRGNESYLIYAYEKEGVLRTGACMRTQPLKRAEEDLTILGEGQEPIENKEKPN